jgi:2-O-methyltransferase
MNNVFEFLTGGTLARDAPLVIFEVGAHLCQDSLALREIFPKAAMFVFEPDPRNVYQIARQGLGKRFTFIDAAVGDRDGKATFHLSGGQPPGAPPHIWTQSSSLKKPVEHLQEYPWCTFDRDATVRIVRLDTFVAERSIDRIDFLWADVQGAEDELIAGGQKALANTRYLYTEFSDRELYAGQISLQQILERLPGPWEVLEQFAYDVLLVNRTLEPSPVAAPAAPGPP